MLYVNYFSLLLIYIIIKIKQSTASFIVVHINNAAQSSPVILNCSSTEQPTLNYTSSLSDSVIVINDVYHINSSKEVGVYHCNGSNVNKTFLALNLTAPMIPHSGKSIIAVTDDKNQTFQCVSYVYHSQTFSWSVKYDYGRNENITDSHQVFRVSNTKTVSSLTIPIVNMTYRGTYTCTVNNFGLSNSTMIKFRVHDRLAPLWAFLGIASEVIVICAIIYLIRKKASKEETRLGVPFQDANSSDDYQDHSHSDLRHRNTVRT